MKKTNRWLKMEPETLAAVLGFGIGLGLAAHEIFFVVPLVIMLVLAAEWTAEKAHEFLRHFRPHMRYPGN